MSLRLLPLRPALRHFSHSQRPLAYRTLASFTHDKENQKLTLPDGRTLGFAEYGAADGRPVLCFHGYPFTRLEMRPVDTIARRNNIRILSLDRPGYGLSSFQPDRRIIDYPEDVKAFAKGVGLERFAVMGLSGGGPYAMACAYGLPSEMLTGVGLFASATPWINGSHHMRYWRRVYRFIGKHWPAAMNAGLAGTVWTMRTMANSSIGAKFIDSMLDKMDEALASNIPLDAPKITNEERRKDFMRLFFEEPFAQGPAGAAWDGRLLLQDTWGFNFEDVNYKPIWIWHGAKDVNAPIAMIQYVVDRLPHCNFRPLKDVTHYTMFPHVEGALQELVYGQKSKESTERKLTPP